jgi:hypothetical protein
MNSLMLAAREFIRKSLANESPDAIIKQLFDRGIHLSLTQEYIIRVLTRPMTDEDLYDAYHFEMFAPKQTAQGIRSRRAELVRKGLVKETGAVLSRYGRKTRLWART